MTSPSKPNGTDAGGDPWLEGPVLEIGDPDEDPEKSTYGRVLPGTVDGELKLEPSLEDGELRVDVVEIVVEGSIADAHLYWEFDTSDVGDDKREWVKVSVGPRPPALATVGSPMFHGGVLGSPADAGIGSPNVYAQGKPVWRTLADQHTCPAATPNPHGSGFVVTLGPPPRVLVNGFVVARAGDAAFEMFGGGLNPILKGASSVLAGLPAPAVESIDPVPRLKEDAWHVKARKWVFDVDVDGEIELDGKLGEQKNTVRGGAKVDPAEGAWGASVGLESEGEAVRGKARGRVGVKGKFFGFDWDWQPIDVEIEGGAGKWKGEADAYYDPITKNRGGSWDWEFGDQE
jgi:uncharacterized Zn-binding protein involved in type VI secretion